MVSILSCVSAIKRNPKAFLDRVQIESLCEKAGYCPRDAGPLDPTTTLALFMQQVLEGNVSCAAVRHLGERRFTPQAYCNARMRLPLSVVREVAGESYRRFSAAVDEREEHRWHGHRVLLIDGSSFSMPDTTELQAHFGQPGMQKAGCGFPVAHLLILFNQRTGLAVDALTAPLRTHEASEVGKIQRHMQSGDLVVGDDSFGTYAHLALLQQRGLHGLFPTHHHRIVDFTPHRSHIEPGNSKEAKGLPRSRWIRRLGHKDQLVEWFKPQRRPDWMTHSQWRSLPASIIVRETRRIIHRFRQAPITLTIVTTLLDSRKYPPRELFATRLRRWDVETDLRHLKTTMEMNVLHCRTVEGVLKELWMFLLVYNLVRMVMLEAADRQNVKVDRISFADALTWMRHARPGETLPKLMIVPYRPGRAEPRVLKRRHDRYCRMTKPRRKWRQEIRKAQLSKKQHNKG